jgi:hypothetical protein
MIGIIEYNQAIFKGLHFIIVDNYTFSEKQNVYTKNTEKRKEKIKMDRIDTEKIMLNEHGGLPRCNKTTCTTAYGLY